MFRHQVAICLLRLDFYHIESGFVTMEVEHKTIQTGIIFYRILLGLRTELIYVIHYSI